MRSITCKIKCSCMDKEQDLLLRERMPDEDVVHYMKEYVELAVHVHHMTVSPRCTAKSLEYLKMPMDDRDRGIGFVSGGNA